MIRLRVTPEIPGGKIADACSRILNSPLLGKLFKPIPPAGEPLRLPHKPNSSNPIPRSSPYGFHSLFK